MSGLLVTLAIGLLIGAWMYNDAKKRGLKQPSVWFFVGFLLGVIGLLFYLFWHVLTKKTKA